MDKQFIYVTDISGNTHCINRNMIAAISPWGTNQKIIILAACCSYPNISPQPIIVPGSFILS